VIARAGRPVAELTPVRTAKPFVFGALKGQLVWDDDAYVTENPTLRDATGLARIWLRIKSYWTLWPYSY